MQSNEDIYVIVKHWLTQRCPRQYRSGDGLLGEIAISVYEFHEERPGLEWSFDSLDAALANFVIQDRARIANASLRQALEDDDVQAQDCAFLWSCGIKADLTDTN